MFCLMQHSLLFTLTNLLISLLPQFVLLQPGFCLSICVVSGKKAFCSKNVLLAINTKLKSHAPSRPYW